MKIEQYDRVRLKDGNEASIVEIFDDDSFLADIDKDGDTYTEEITVADILKVIKYIKKMTIAEENKDMNDMQMELNRLIQRVERKKVRAIEEQYGLELNDEAKRVFSMASDDPIFLGEDGSVRILSMDEILEASEDMEVDFASYQIIPIADVYDNDYIVYDAKNECWCMFNIVDEVKFGKEKNFIDCFDEDADDDDEDFDDEDFE